MPRVIICSDCDGTHTQHICIMYHIHCLIRYSDSVCLRRAVPLKLYLILQNTFLLSLPLVFVFLISLVIAFFDICDRTSSLLNEHTVTDDSV